jgi:heme-degrading monooxygenase HmoA
VSTLSIWASSGHLNAYRKSALFGEVWPQTKSGFAHPPRAESYFWDPSLGFPS